jgi:hypothetical protein
LTEPESDYKDLVIADFNGDLNPDLIAAHSYTHHWSDAIREEDLPSRVINAKQAPFVALTNPSTGHLEVQPIGSCGMVPYFGFSIGAADFDNDQDLDLYMTGATGYVINQARLYLNNGAAGDLDAGLNLTGASPLVVTGRGIRNIDILDASGRMIFSSSVPSTTFMGNGKTSSGSNALPGVYVIRLTTSSGVFARRCVRQR